MTIQTLRPNVSGSRVGWDIVGGGTAHGATSDNSNATYLLANTSASGSVYDNTKVGLGYGTYTLAANERVKRVRVKVKQSGSTGGTLAFYLVGAQIPSTSTASYTVRRYYTTSVLEAPVTVGLTATDQTTGWWTTIGGAAWTQEQINDLTSYTSASKNGPRMYELYIELDVDTPPTTSAVAITSTALVRPTVGFTYTDAESDPQARYQIKVFSAAQYGAVGFSAATSTAAWDSGEVAASDTSVQVGTDLSFGTTYKAYVRTAQTFNAELLWSDWAASSATALTSTADTVTTQPAAPTLTVTPDTTVPNLSNRLELTTAFNLLTANQASIETDTAGWTAGANTTLSRSTAIAAATGLAFLVLTSSASGDVTTTTATGVSGFPVKAGSQYTAIGSARSPVSSRTARVDILWYGAAGAALTPSTGTGSATSTGAWGQRTVTATAPTGAVYAAVRLHVASTGAGSEAHYFDSIGLHPGSTTTWTSGGYLDESAEAIEYADVTSGTSNLATPQLATGSDTEAATGGFFARVSTDTVTSDTADRYLGARSIRWDANTADGFLDIGLPSGTFVDSAPAYALPLVPARIYTVSVYAKASVSFASKLYIQPVDAGGTAVGAGANGGAITITTGWQRFQVTVTAPAGAVWARAAFENTADVTGVSVWVDAVQWEEAAAAGTFTIGQGLAPVWTAVSAAETALTVDRATQTLRLYDNTPPPGYIRVYRAQTTVTPTTGTLGSAFSAYVPTVMTTPGVWVLKDPYGVAPSMTVHVRDTVSEEIDEDVTAFRPLGRDRPVSVSDFMGGTDGSYDFYTRGEAEWAQLETLLRLRRVLLLVFTSGGQRYIRITKRSLERVGGRANLTRKISVAYHEEEAP